MASLRKRHNTRFWFACFTLPDGTRAQRSTKTTDRRLAQKLADHFEEASRISLTESQARRVISDIHKSLSGRALNMQTVRNYLVQWSAARKGSVAQSTLKEYQSTVGEFLSHLKNRADVDLTFITASDIVAFRDSNAARLSTGSVNKKLKILRVAFQQAWRDGIIEQNIAAKVQTLKKSFEEVERRSFKLDELQKLLSVTEGEWQGMILFGLYTGQRLGDITRLRWDHLDLDQAIITLTTRKTRRRQILPIAKPLLAWIKHWKLSSTSKELFPKANEVVTRDERVGALSNQFYDLLAQAGLVEKRSHSKKSDGGGRSVRRAISDVSFHSLRHTATSLMKNSGISPAIVQEFVGHDSKEISQNYTHIDTESMRTAADSLPGLYRK